MLSRLRLALAFLAAAFVPARSPAQAERPEPAPTPSAASRSGGALRADSCETLLSRVRRDPNALTVPSADAYTLGEREVAAGTRIRGSVATCGGDLTVLGTVEGDAIALSGDVILGEGGVVTGNAFAVSGRVRLEGGRVEGEMRTIRGRFGAVPRRATAPPLSPAQATARALKIVAGFLTMLAIIGIGVLIFAGGYLEGVVVTLERDVTKSFWMGLVGQLALLPALSLLVVGLTLTILGILLVPFAIVAFVLAAVGLLTLGFLAVSQVTGGALRKPGTRVMTARGAALRALVTGVALYIGLWLLAAAFTWSAYAGATLRVIALAITWVATTAGFGAALISRAGSRRAAAVASGRGAPFVPPPKEDDFAWQTPTPVSGVVAARRPTPAASSIKDLK